MRLKKSKLALTLTIALSATSCATQKRAAEIHSTELTSLVAQSEERTRLEEESGARIFGMIEERLREMRQTTSRSDETVERIEEIFDTSQPRDTATGTPPLLSRTKERRSTQNQTDSRAQTEATTTGHAKADINSHKTEEAESSRESNEQRQTATDEKSREETGARPTTIVLATLGAAALTVFLAWLIFTVTIAIKRFLTPN